MKRVIFFGCFVLLNICVSGQKYKPVTVKAGERISDYFSIGERYRYPEFTKGKCIFKSGRSVPDKFNLNFLSGEIELIKAPDTLSVSNKKDLRLVTIAQDTFYYYNGFVEKISGGHLSVFIKQSIEIKDILRQGAMGTVNRNAASESYKPDPTGFSYNRTLENDMVLQKTDNYYFTTSTGDYTQFTKKNIIKAVPGKEDEMKNYIKTNNIDFESREDLLKLAGFINGQFK